MNTPSSCCGRGDTWRPPPHEEKGEATMADTYEPVIIGFLCNWCAYAGGDLAGVSRLQYPTNMRAIRVMCSGMVHPNLIVDALRKGADGVIVMG
jgi:F420-non-reducing hydrogenase iron-sulfur subunit